ncbi:CpsD/CapB family tyrosine-protein kinase [Sphingobium subterraneum]|uniref:Capsular exopolysaccharide synthesis family protein n=1 Tax=Sphingobium subterraneum TaxID=627688 RepID=A0A841IUZ3_9SPHN|nr:capsular exopolysaccharide synthesis family protein [Sphingobium subterraneum]
MSDNNVASSSVSARPVRIPGAEELPEFVPDATHLKDTRIVGFKARHIAARPFSLLRTQVEKKLQANGWKLIGITSSSPGAGKSFLSANLAATLSRVPGRETYLFDLDIRRASQAHYFGLSGKAGIADFLNGDVTDLREVGQQVSGTNLSIFPTYPTDLESMQLLAGEEFAALVKAMRALPSNATIICDLPPVFANDDAMIISQSLDAFMLVVEQGVTNRKQVKDSLRLLQPTPCLGTILNRYEGGFSDPYGYGGRYGGQYADYYVGKND